jgi:hypothetical protein
MRTLRDTRRGGGNVAYFDDGPRPDRAYEVGDSVETRDAVGCVTDIGAVVAPSDMEFDLPHQPTDRLIDWMKAGRKWTRWQDFRPRY